MGEHLASILANEHNVWVTSRSVHKNSEKIKYICGDAHDILFLKNTLLDQHWDSIIDFMLYKTEEFIKHIELILAATKQYIFLSSSRVYASSNKLLTEESDRLLDVCTDNDYLATDEYALAKAKQEDYLRNIGNMNFTIVRPYITYSESRLQLGPLEKENWLYRVLTGKPIIFAKDLLNKYTTLTYGYDVSNTISYLIGNKTSLGQIFNITAKDSYTWQEILDFYLDIIEKKTGIRPIVCYIDSFININFYSNSAQIKYDRLFDRKFDSSKLRNINCNIEFCDTFIGLEKCLNTFLNNPTFLNVNQQIQIEFDNLSDYEFNSSQIYYH